MTSIKLFPFPFPPPPLHQDCLDIATVQEQLYEVLNYVLTNGPNQSYRPADIQGSNDSLHSSSVPR